MFGSIALNQDRICKRNVRISTGFALFLRSINYTSLTKHTHTRVHTHIYACVHTSMLSHPHDNCNAAQPTIDITHLAIICDRNMHSFDSCWDWLNGIWQSYIRKDNTSLGVCMSRIHIIRHTGLPGHQHSTSSSSSSSFRLYQIL